SDATRPPFQIPDSGFRIPDSGSGFALARRVGLAKRRSAAGARRTPGHCPPATGPPGWLRWPGTCFSAWGRRTDRIGLSRASGENLMREQPADLAQEINRRGFLGAGAGALTAAATLGNGPPAAAQAAPRTTQSAVLPKRTLGRTGVEVTILTLGT